MRIGVAWGSAVDILTTGSLRAIYLPTSYAGRNQFACTRRRGRGDARIPGIPIRTRSIARSSKLPTKSPGEWSPGNQHALVAHCTPSCSMNRFHWQHGKLRGAGKQLFAQSIAIGARIARHVVACLQKSVARIWAEGAGINSPVHFAAVELDGTVDDCRPHFTTSRTSPRGSIRSIGATGRRATTAIGGAAGHGHPSRLAGPSCATWNKFSSAPLGRSTCLRCTSFWNL